MNTSSIRQLLPSSLVKLWIAAASLALGIAAITAPSLAAEVSLKQVAGGFTAPIALAPLADGSGRLLVVDQIGTVSVLNKDGSISEKLFLDVREKLTPLKQGFDERGLLCVILHPRFKENGKVYAAYSAPLRPGATAGWDHTMHISEFTAVDTDHSTVDASAERVLFRVDKPYFNHNCGRLAFGPDGYLYIGVGDGGGANGMDGPADKIVGHVAKGNSQDLTQLLGKILRIDVNKTEGDKAYAIPSENPFTKGGGRPEIFAYGVRNCWGISFDRGGQHELFAADVGQSSWEEVNLIVKGANYGWPRREGFGCFDGKNPTKPPEDCPKVDDDGKPFTDPIIAYKNLSKFPKDPEARGTSVTGGYVYRGKALPQLQGKYVFGDWSRSFVKADGVIYTATRPSSGSGPWTMEALPLVDFPDGKIRTFVWAFGEDEDGELYVFTNTTNALIGKNGKLWKLTPM